MYNSSYNSFGQIGLIQIPSALSRPEGTVAFSFNKNDMWKFGTLSVSPFNWMEASYFYYRPSDLVWEGDLKKGHYLDKGFNVKFIYRPNKKNSPNIAVGLDDFAGTGYFTREYIVATYNKDSYSYSFGMGWGKFAGDNSFENPLKSIKESMSIRPFQSDNFKTGGTPSYDLWFRGNAALFAGIEMKIPKINNLNFKIEYDPFNYLDFSANNRPDASYELRKKDSDINFGLSYKLNKYLTVDASYIKGNTINLNFNIAITFNDNLVDKNKFEPIVTNDFIPMNEKDMFYESLLYNLNRNRLLLQTSNLDKNGNLDISISTSEHRNAIRSSSYSANVAKKVAELNNIDLKLINVTHINAGVELNKLTYVANYFDKENITPLEVKIRNTAIDSGKQNSYLLDNFKPTVNFPVIFSSISPSLDSHVGNPEKFYFGGINLQHLSEIQFSRNLLLSSQIVLPIESSIKDSISGPSSLLPHVRTDIIQYLKEDDIYIKRMQLDYIWSPAREIYTKVSAGIYESMFAGIGGEFLYKPFNKNFDIGLEMFYVKQRSFNQRFSFQEYETFTGHINFGYKYNYGIETNLSYGRYLAKDDGFTLDIGRTTKSGFKAGIYFTRTNISPELFGEGSFDKGFYFQIPMDLLSKDYRGTYSSFKLSPLTRDGGAKLIHDKDLKGLIYNSSYYELSRQWNGFMN